MNQEITINDSDDDLLFTKTNNNISRIKNNKNKKKGLLNNKQLSYSIDLLSSDDDDNNNKANKSSITCNKIASNTTKTEINDIINTNGIKDVFKDKIIENVIDDNILLPNDNDNIYLDQINDDEQVLQAKRLFSTLNQTKVKLNTEKPISNNHRQTNDITNSIDDFSISDVIIPKIKSAAERLLEAQAVISNTNTTITNTNNTNTNNKPVESTTSKLIKLKTRLNGKHEWKWKISINDKFEKMKVKFSEIYGIKLNDFKFIFDGEKLSDSDCPSDLDMEDDTIIDVKIDLKLYDKAIESATNYNSNKTINKPTTSSSNNNTISNTISNATSSISNCTTNSISNDITSNLITKATCNQTVNDSISDKLSNLTNIIVHFTSSNPNSTNDQSIVNISKSIPMNVLSTYTLQDLLNQLISNKTIESNELIEFTLKSNPNVIISLDQSISNLMNDSIQPLELLIRPGRYEIKLKLNHTIDKAINTNIKIIIRSDYQLTQVVRVISNKWMISEANAILEFNNKILANYSMTLKDCGLTNGSVIYVSSK